MENLGDILKRLDATRPSPDGSSDGRRMEAPSQPADVCRICGGRGWYTPDVPAGHPSFGRIVTCDCQKERLIEERSTRLLRYSNLGHLTRFTFDTLDARGRADDPESQRLFGNACETAVEYADNPAGWLIFTGPNGSGKTHLAAAIANRAIQQGHVVFFVHVPDLLDHLRATYAPASDISYSEMFDQVVNTPLLILDGLGSQSTTPWAQEKLHQIINHRFNAQLPTIVTTALDLEELDPYIRTRLQSPGLGRILEVRSRQPAQVHRLGRIEPEMLRRMTFETFDMRGNNTSDAHRRSLEAACQFAKNYAADPDGWLTIFGETGVGKTHLAVAIASERMRQGQPVFFAFVPELLDYLRYTFTPESRVTYDRIFDEIKNTALLILDDLGQENSSPWAYEKLYQIIVHRHNTRLPTVITSMVDFSEERGPISSRVQDPSVSQLIRIDAPDYRIKERRDRPPSAGRNREPGRGTRHQGA
jgi:DNA replication protein DnaC